MLSILVYKTTLTETMHVLCILQLSKPTYYDQYFKSKFVVFLCKTLQKGCIDVAVVLSVGVCLLQTKCTWWTKLLTASSSWFALLSLLRHNIAYSVEGQRSRANVKLQVGVLCIFHNCLMFAFHIEYIAFICLLLRMWKCVFMYMYSFVIFLRCDFLVDYTTCKALHVLTIVICTSSCL